MECIELNCVNVWKRSEAAKQPFLHCKLSKTQFFSVSIDKTGVFRTLTNYFNLLKTEVAVYIAKFLRIAFSTDTYGGCSGSLVPINPIIFIALNYCQTSVMIFCSVNMLERDGMPIQILIKQQVWNDCWTRNSYLLLIL